MKTKKLVLMALFTALCFIGTWLHIPVTTALGLVIAIPLALAVKKATQRFIKGVFVLE